MRSLGAAVILALSTPALAFDDAYCDQVYSMLVSKLSSRTRVDIKHRVIDDYAEACRNEAQYGYKKKKKFVDRTSIICVNKGASDDFREAMYVFTLDLTAKVSRYQGKKITYGKLRGLKMGELTQVAETGFLEQISIGPHDEENPGNPTLGKAVVNDKPFEMACVNASAILDYSQVGLPR